MRQVESEFKRRADKEKGKRDEFENEMHRQYYLTIEMQQKANRTDEHLMKVTKVAQALAKEGEVEEEKIGRKIFEEQIGIIKAENEEI